MSAINTSLRLNTVATSDSSGLQTLLDWLWRYIARIDFSETYPPAQYVLSVCSCVIKNQVKVKLNDFEASTCGLTILAELSKSNPWGLAIAKHSIDQVLQGTKLSSVGAAYDP
jgi:hypothetical protein